MTRWRVFRPYVLGPIRSKDLVSTHPDRVFGTDTVDFIYFTEKLCFIPSLTCGLPVLRSGRKQTSV